MNSLTGQCEACDPFFRGTSVFISLNDPNFGHYPTSAITHFYVRKKLNNDPFYAYCLFFSERLNSHKMELLTVLLFTQIGSALIVVIFILVIVLFGKRSLPRLKNGQRSGTISAKSFND